MTSLYRNAGYAVFAMSGVLMLAITPAWSRMLEAVPPVRAEHQDRGVVPVPENGALLLAQASEYEKWFPKDGDPVVGGIRNPVAPEPAGSPHGESATEPDNDCDKYASLRLPGTPAASVVPPNDSDWIRVVASCQALTEAHPDVMRYVYELGRAQSHAKDYVGARRNFVAASAAGVSEALVDLSGLYYNGLGVLQSYTLALDYMSKAAATGSPRALGYMAVFYGEGRGVPKDDARALDYAGKAVEAGNPFGLKIMADHYFNGAGVPRDYKMAANYLLQAADLGSGLAMKMLANMYESGYLGAPDPAKATELRMRARRVDPSSPDQAPFPMFRAGANTAQVSGPVVVRRPYMTYRYNPAWQAAPGDTSCCPNNMLVCPLGRHFCGH